MDGQNGRKLVAEGNSFKTGVRRENTFGKEDAVGQNRQSSDCLHQSFFRPRESQIEQDSKRQPDVSVMSLTLVERT